MPGKMKTFGKYAGYVILGIVLTLYFMFLTFPYESLKDHFLPQLEKSLPYKVIINQIRATPLLWIQISGIRIIGDAQKKTSLADIATVGVRPAFLDLLIGKPALRVKADLYNGSIKGKVGSDISIVGRDWDQNRQMLRLGVLAHGKETSHTLWLVVRGRHRRVIDFEVAKVFPLGVVQAALGEEKSIRGGTTIRVPLEIHISKQSGPANYLGSKQNPTGHVLLYTNHPEVPEIKIPISFAIEGG